LVGTTTGDDHDAGTTTLVEIVGTVTITYKVLWSGATCDDGTVLGTLCHETMTTECADETTSCWVAGNVEGKSFVGITYGDVQVDGTSTGAVTVT
jgi:hypothetical protein